MPIYLVIYSIEATPGVPWTNIKTIYYVIPTTLEEVQEVLDKYTDVLRRSERPFMQWELVKRVDTGFLDEIVKGGE